MLRDIMANIIVVVGVIVAAGSLVFGTFILEWTLLPIGIGILIGMIMIVVGSAWGGPIYSQHNYPPWHRK